LGRPFVGGRQVFSSFLWTGHVSLSVFFPFPPQRVKVWVPSLHKEVRKGLGMSTFSIRKYTPLASPVLGTDSTCKSINIPSFRRMWYYLFLRLFVWFLACSDLKLFFLSPGRKGYYSLKTRIKFYPRHLKSLNPKGLRT
jgi:hypothetical protein